MKKGENRLRTGKTEGQRKVTGRAHRAIELLLDVRTSRVGAADGRMGGIRQGEMGVLRTAYGCQARTVAPRAGEMESIVVIRAKAPKRRIVESFKGTDVRRNQADVRHNHADVRYNHADVRLNQADTRLNLTDTEHNLTDVRPNLAHVRRNLIDVSCNKAHAQLAVQARSSRGEPR